MVSHLPSPAAERAQILSDALQRTTGLLQAGVEVRLQRLNERLALYGFVFTVGGLDKLINAADPTRSLKARLVSTLEPIIVVKAWFRTFAFKRVNQLVPLRCGAGRDHHGGDVGVGGGTAGAGVVEFLRAHARVGVAPRLLVMAQTRLYPVWRVDVMRVKRRREFGEFGDPIDENNNTYPVVWATVLVRTTGCNIRFNTHFARKAQSLHDRASFRGGGAMSACALSCFPRLSPPAFRLPQGSRTKRFSVVLVSYF